MPITETMPLDTAWCALGAGLAKHILNMTHGGHYLENTATLPSLTVPTEENVQNPVVKLRGSWVANLEHRLLLASEACRVAGLDALRAGCARRDRPRSAAGRSVGIPTADALSHPPLLGSLDTFLGFPLKPTSPSPSASPGLPYRTITHLWLRVCRALPGPSGCTYPRDASERC